MRWKSNLAIALIVVAYLWVVAAIITTWWR